MYKQSAVTSLLRFAAAKQATPPSGKDVGEVSRDYRRSTTAQGTVVWACGRNGEPENWDEMHTVGVANCGGQTIIDMGELDRAPTHHHSFFVD